MPNSLAQTPTEHIRIPIGTTVRDTGSTTVRSPLATERGADTVRSQPATESEQPHRDGPIRLQVLNGCGVKGLARLITPGLRAKGFDVREVRNAGHFRYKKSEVLDRSGTKKWGSAVADSLGIDAERVTDAELGNLVDIDVTLIVGADYVELDLKKFGD